MTDPLRSTTPSSGCRPPRSQGGRRSTRTLDLSGRWRFRLSPTAAGTGPVPTAASVGEGEIDVPGHWVLQGHGDPLYTNTAYPFPIDPPFVPDANPTGDHLRTFTVPAGWRHDGSTLLFQGVDSAARVWLNGVELGWFTGSRLPAELDVSHVLREGENTLAVRVHRWSSGSYLEDQDMWWLPGIFREVLLLEGADVDDVRVRADHDHTDGSGTLTVDVLGRDGAPLAGAVLDAPELGLTAATVGVPHRIEQVRPWSAERPDLYDVVVRHGDETVTLRVGFRTVVIEGGRLLVNGVPLRMRGVNRHEQHWERGRTLTREEMLADVLLMKQHHVDAVRTSHYPPHPDFLQLCDEHGLWVVLEGDLETHGFIYDGWERNPPADPAWTPAVLDRTARMVQRDRNHPSVVLWSLGNESEDGEGFDAAQRWVRTADPTRPIHYERGRTYRNSDVYSLMYPSLEELAAVGRREEPTPEVLADDPEGDARRRAMPFLLCEYAHAMGNGPGSLADYEAVLEGSDRFCGAFVWEWIDHGYRGTAPDGREIVRHGGDIAYQPNGGRYCLDGLLTPDRTPSPGLAELARANEPVRVEITADTAADADAVIIRSRYRWRDTAHLAWAWAAEVDGEVVVGGDLAVPAVAPGATVRVALPDVAWPDVPGERWLTVTATLERDEPWAPAGHRMAWGQGRVAGPSTSRAAPRGGRPVERDGTIAVGPATLDAATGALRRLGDVGVAELRADVWRAPTENDHGQGALNDQVRVWRAVGLDRMLVRTEGVTVDDGGVTVRTRLAPATQPIAVAATLRWEATEVDGAPAVRCRVTLEPTGPWHDTPYGHHRVLLPRLGLRLRLEGRYAALRWFGLGPGEGYVDSRDALRAGRWERDVDELGFDYPFPQENGNRHRVRWAELRGGGLPTLRVDAEPEIDVSVRRWTSEDLDAARKPHELRDSGVTVVNLDAGQRGLGSSSVGPALPDRYEVPLTTTSYALTFSLPG